MSPEQNQGSVDIVRGPDFVGQDRTLTPEEIEERKADQAEETPEEETPEEETPEEETPEEETPEEETPEEETPEDGLPLDETIKSYRILGMVDYTDEQGNIVGQLKVGSVYQMPAYVGDLAVEEGRAEEVQ